MMSTLALPLRWRWVLLAAMALVVASPGAQAQKTKKKHPAIEAQLPWYEPTKERSDLVPGAFEVVRFPVESVSTPRYERDPKSKRILNPDYHCTACIAEGRTAPSTGREGRRLVERDEGAVLDWIAEELRPKGSAFLEDEDFKLYIDLPKMALRKNPSRYLAEDIEALRNIFPEMKKGTRLRYITGHQRAHLYLFRAQRLMRDFLWMTGTTDAEIKEKWPHLGPHLGMRNKLEVFVFVRPRDYQWFCDGHIGRVIPTGQAWHHMQDNALFVAMTDAGNPDARSHNAFIHRITHNLLDAYRRYGFKMPGWLQIGLAHWIERRENQRWNTYCWGEGTEIKEHPTYKWLLRVRRLVRQDKAMPFVEGASRIEYSEFSEADHLIAYSWFCYLMRLGPEKLRVFINALKDRKPDAPHFPAQVEAFKRAYGVDMLRFDEGWRRWVREIYPLK